MLPTIDDALFELKLAENLNPGPWVKHSINLGIAARNIAEKVSWLNPEKAYRVHHTENVENKGFCALLINTASSELVTIRTVLLLNGGVHQMLNRSF